MIRSAVVWQISLSVNKTLDLLLHKFIYFWVAVDNAQPFGDAFSLPKHSFPLFKIERDMTVDTTSDT